MELTIELDKDKLLDHAIFMLIEARNKCKNDFGIIAEPRILIALKELNIINDILSNGEYPSTEYLENKDII